MTTPVVSYKPLWKTLTDKDMTKQDLRKATGLSSATITKTGWDETVSTQVLARIFEALECDISDICTIGNSQEVGSD